MDRPMRCAALIEASPETVDRAIAAHPDIEITSEGEPRVDWRFRGGATATGRVHLAVTPVGVLVTVDVLVRTPRILLGLIRREFLRRGQLLLDELRAAP